MRWTYALIEKYRTVTNVVGTVLTAWALSAVAGQVIALFLPTPTPVLSSDSNDARSFLGESEFQTAAYYAPICERNIFDSLHRTQCVSDEPEAAAEEDLDAPPVKSDISATLLGTMVSTNPDHSFANISPRGSESANFHIGDSLMGEAKIYDIQRNRVFFIRNGHREYLEVEHLPQIYDRSETAPPPSGGGIKRVGDKAIISRSKVDATLGNLNQIVQQSRMVPNFENGAVNGFKIFAIQPGSIFDELGLKNGDVVQRINGTEIDSVEKALPMLQLLKTETSISIDITRGGLKKSLTIDIQ